MKPKTNIKNQLAVSQAKSGAIKRARISSVNLSMDFTTRKNRKYSVVPFQPSWVQSFLHIESQLKPLFGDLAIEFQHVGSTAVEGMSGKATIDVLIVVRHIHAVDSLNHHMEQLGYKVLGDYLKQGGRLFAKEVDGERIANVHCFELDHGHIREMLVMRDFLRSHPDEAERYEKLKIDLFSKYPDDYIAYRAVKDPYLQEMKVRAFEWDNARIMNGDMVINTRSTPTSSYPTI